jgi:chlorophyll synthase
LKSLIVASRSEFLPANLTQFFIGVAWGINPAMGFTWELGLLLLLPFMIITLAAAWGAQANSLFDYDLDSRDTRKATLVKAMDDLGPRKVKGFMLLEFFLSVPLLYLLVIYRANLNLILVWGVGSFLTFFYSAPPLRLKSRSWFQVAAIMLVLSIFPLLFMFYTLTAVFDPIFLWFLAGHTLIIWSIIVPAEIRDYFGDKALGVETATVRLGLEKASRASAVLLAMGTLIAGEALFIRFVLDTHVLLALSLLAMAAATVVILRQLWRLRNLAAEYEMLTRPTTAEAIVDLSAQNPKWITLVTQASVLVHIVLLVGRFLF